MKARAINKGLLLSGAPTITFELDKTDRSFLDNDMLDGRDLDLTVKAFRKKRSLNANAYMWELCGKLAETLDGVTKDDVYREAVRNTGVYKDIELPIEDAETLQTAWKLLGTGWITERIDFGNSESTVRIRFYYGTSRYNTAQMSRIIDGLVQDCKAVGIKTLDDVEIERLVSAWNQ